MVTCQLGDIVHGERVGYGRKKILEHFLEPRSLFATELIIRIIKITPTVRALRLGSARGICLFCVFIYVYARFVRFFAEEKVNIGIDSTSCARYLILLYLQFIKGMHLQAVRVRLEAFLNGHPFNFDWCGAYDLHASPVRTGGKQILACIKLLHSTWVMVGEHDASDKKRDHGKDRDDDAYFQGAKDFFHPFSSFLCFFSIIQEWAFFVNREFVKFFPFPQIYFKKSLDNWHPFVYNIL